MTASTPPEPPEGGDRAFEALWQRAVEVWDEDKPHAAILEYALRTDKLPDLAGRYRALKEDPEKGERARAQIDAIVLAATQLMLSMKSPPRTKPPLSMTLSAVGVCVTLLGWLAYALLRH